jgi:plastocyanin
MHPGVRSLAAATVLALGAACSSSGGGGETTGAPGGEPGSPGPAIEIRDFAFDVTGVELVAGRQATIRVTNSGGVTHDLSIPAIEASLDYEPGHSSNLIFIAPSQPGPIELFCKYHREQGMQVTLVVRG